MRIGISTLMIQRGKTGIAQHVFALVRAFSACAGEHEFILFVLEEDLPLFAFARNHVRLVRVSESFRPPLKSIYWHQFRLPKLAQAYDLDVVHTPSYRRLAWQKKCALVGTIHDLAPFRLSGKYDWPRMFYGRVVVKRLARRQDEIITVSRSTAADIETFFGVSSHRISVIPNGVDPERFFPGNRENAQAYVSKKYQLNGPFFLYIARLEHPGKNHVRLIAAFNAFKQRCGTPWKLVFAGSNWHGAEAIHRAIEQSPFAPDIRALGFVPDDDLPDLYRAADVFVYPSLFEGFGMPVVEAMACGCPVVCSKDGALGEVAGEAAVTVDPCDITDLQTALLRTATDEALRRKLRQSGLDRARQFNWEAAAEETIKVYARAVARKAGQSIFNDSEPVAVHGHGEGEDAQKLAH